MKEYNEAIALIQQNPDMGTFVGPREESLIELAEKTLGQVFPPSYRRFALELGAGNFGAAEIYGVIDDDFENSSIPDGVWYTLHLRATQGLPAHFLAIGEDGMGGVMCIDCREDGNGEGSVLVVRLGAPESVVQEKVASNFGTYLLEMVTAELEEES